MNRPFLLSIVLLLSLLQGVAQNPIALQYTSQHLREEFSEQNENWTYMTTVENLYMPDKGDLFMHRNNQSSAYAFITTKKNDLKVFSIQSKVKLGPTETADQTIGVICLVQRDGKGAVVVEFNKFKQYRIKKLIGAYYRQISGTVEEQGWVKSNFVKGKEEYNEVEVRVALPQVDVYINGKLAQSFDMPEYGPGEMGLIIGPNTKAKADYFYVYTTSDEVVQLDERKAKSQEKLTITEQLANMRYELEHKDRNLKECQMERQKAVSLLEEQVGQLSSEKERLAMQNRQLAEFRDQVLVDIDEDVFLTLVQNLKDEIKKNERLESQVEVYRDSLKQTHANYNKLKLALLDKSIAKGQKDKAEREKQEALATKKDIEKELLDKKLTKEQEEWEKKNFKAATAKTTKAEGEKKTAATSVAESKPKAEAEEPAKTTNPEVTTTTSSEAGSLPVPVRKAVKSPN